MQSVNWASVDDSVDVRNLLLDTDIAKSLKGIIGVEATLSDYLGSVKLSFIRDFQHFDITVCAHSMSVCFWRQPSPANSWDELHQQIRAVQPEWQMFIWEAQHIEAKATLCDSPRMAVDMLLKFCQQKIT